LLYGDWEGSVKWSKSEDLPVAVNVCRLSGKKAKDGLISNLISERLTNADT